MVIARGAESPTLKAHPSRPSEPSHEEGKLNAVYEPSGRKESQMRIHESVKRNDEEEPEQDWRDEVKIAMAYVEFNQEFIGM